MRNVIRIGTRQSPLALWQANTVKMSLLDYYPHFQVELVPFITQGDKWLDVSLSKIGGKGLFVKELEQALLNDEVDIAVHSMKDLPMDLPEGLSIAAILARGSVEDVFVSEQFHSLENMPFGARIGTSSARRKAILEEMYPNLSCVDVRGNIQTRLNKCASASVDALILAAAGLERLNLSDKITARLSLDTWLPAPGQGAIGLEIKSNNLELKSYLNTLNDINTWDAVMAERAVSRTLNGGCSLPLAAYALLEKDVLYLRAWLKREDTGKRHYAQVEGFRQDAQALGENAAKILLCS